MVALTDGWVLIGAQDHVVLVQRGRALSRRHMTVSKLPLLPLSVVQILRRVRQEEHRAHTGHVNGGSTGAGSTTELNGVYTLVDVRSNRFPDGIGVTVQIKGSNRIIKRFR